MSNLGYISTSFIVASIETSVAFYVDKLGFKIRYTGPDDDPFWAIVGRDEISIFLKKIAPGVNAISLSHSPAVSFNKAELF